MSQAGRFLLGSGSNPPIETLTGNSGGPVGPDGAFNINIVGDGTTVTVVGNPGTNTLTISTTGAVATQYDTDAGNAVPAAGILNVLGGHDINTTGAGNTVTINLDNAITLGDLAPVVGDALDVVTGDISLDDGNLNLTNTNGAGTSGVIQFGGIRSISNFGTDNFFIGQLSGNTSLTGINNYGFGDQVLNNLSTGSNNSSYGHESGLNITTGTQNSSYGSFSLSTATTAGNNTAIGYGSLQTVVGQRNTALGSGSLQNLAGAANNNIAVGYLSGSAYTTTESFNITVGNIGTLGDSNTIRIGTPVSQTRFFAAGIDGVNVGSVVRVVTETSNQLGTADITAGTNITVTPSANAITISSSSTVIAPNYSVANASPYVVQADDYYITVDTSTIPITIQLPDAPTQYQIFVIKDSAGNASANNVTVTTVSGLLNIDAATTFVMNTDWEAIQVLYDGFGYQVW